MKVKEFDVKYRDEGNGSLEGYASTWIREPDSYGDVVKSGAFTRTLNERWNGGKGIPLLWAHQMDNLNAFIGTAEAEEDQKGLHFLAQFDGTDEAQRVRELYKDGRLRKFSFAYDVKDASKVTLEDGRKANELRDLELYEISCVCVPANDDAGVLAVKAMQMDEPEAVEPEEPEIKSEEPKKKEIDAVYIVEHNEPEVKAGRRNSAKDADTINQIINLAKSLLDSEEEEPEVNGEDEPEVNAAAEEQTASNPEKDRLLELIKSHEMEGRNEPEE